MPIRDLTPAWREIGRIRIGRQVPRSDGRGTRPDKLQTFRLTSANRDAIDAAAGLYGGRPEAWQGPAGPAWEVVTESATLDAVLPPGDVLSQWYELWSCGGAKRRCDGLTEQISGGPCRCPADLNERAEAAKGERPTACRPISRLRVILPGLPDLGVWRLEAHGRIAAAELAATAAAIEIATRRGAYVPGRLRLEQRRTGTPPRSYGVPVLELPAVDAGRLLTGPGETYSPASLLTAQEPDPGPDDDEPPDDIDPGPPPTREELERGALVPDYVADEIAARYSAPPDEERPSYTDPDSPDFLGPEPEWVEEHRRRREAEAPEPEDEPQEPPVDRDAEPLPTGEIANALEELHELADKHHRTPNEAIGYLWTIAQELRPELAGAVEDLERVPRAAWRRVRRRFELGDYDPTAAERAAKRAREAAASQAADAERRIGPAYNAEPDTLGLEPEPPK
jgi:hypothetical protein